MDLSDPGVTNRDTIAADIEQRCVAMRGATLPDLLDGLRQGDGVTKAQLTRVAENHRPDRATAQVLTDVLAGRDVRAQDAATWIVLSWARRGFTLPEAMVSALCAYAATLEGWQSRLHLCQLLRLVTLTPVSRRTVLPFLTRAARDDRPFLRAWALDARFHITPGRAGRARLLACAASDPAAAVRARARQLAKLLM